jgi:hypothetical protein
MLIKSVLVFLLVMVFVAMIGRAIAPSATNRILRNVVPRASRCHACGRYLIGRKDCDCKKKA